MANYYYYPDDVFFAANPENSTEKKNYGNMRLLKDDASKLMWLQHRIQWLHVNSVIECNHPFGKMTLTCQGLEILAYIFLAPKDDKDLRKQIIKVYSKLDNKMKKQLTKTFKSQLNQGNTSNVINYADFIRIGYRNNFMHSFRTIGVFLNTEQDELLSIYEFNGYLIVNPNLFARSYIRVLNQYFEQANENLKSNYAINALRYFNSLIG
jgi:hypothetical protein